LTIPTTHRQRYPTAYPPSLPTQLVHAFRIIARISRQLLRTHLRQRFGLQIATCASVIAPHSVHLPKHVDMPIASCDFVIARPPDNLHTAREQVATHHQPRDRDIALPPLNSASLVVGTAGVDSPNRDIALPSLTSASLVVGTAGGRFPKRDIALASLTSARLVVGTAGG
jgi:hypothetical protein